MFEASSSGRKAAPKAFQRYRLIRRIARGGMAEVYLAVLRGAAGFERRVALKKILPVYAGIEEFTKLFRDEARIWAVLNHSGVVQVYDFGQHQGDPWIAMEFIDGPDLEEVLDRCRRRGIHPPVDVVIHLGHRLASALEYAHGVRDPSGEELHIIHRDISPPNILLSVQGDVKLTDFGVAKASTRDSLTRPGVLRGKYAYMSPEQVQHKPIDHRSDLFGLGILLYETLTGVNPFEGPTDYQTIESVGRAEVEPAGFLRPDTPAELDRILLGLLEPDPELRYQTGGELRRDLAALMLERPEADEPETLVAFLRDLFPERTPQAQSSGNSSPGAPGWEALAHVITAYDVPVPERFPEGPGAAVRLEERPPLRDSLWASAPPSGDSWSAVSNEETVAGAVGEQLRLAPALRFATPGDGWDDVSRNEWSVEGEDPDEALQPTQHAAPIQLGLLADQANLPPLPWGDDPEDEVRYPSEHASDDGYPTLRDTDPGIVTLDRTTLQETETSRGWGTTAEWQGEDAHEARETNPQAQATEPPSEWSAAPAKEPAPGASPLPEPSAPRFSVDTLLDHIQVRPRQTDLGLPDLNEWELSESAFGPSEVVETVESPVVDPEPPDEPKDAPAPVAADLQEPEAPSLMPTARSKRQKLPEGPIKATAVIEVGKPAVARAPGMESQKAMSVGSGHRRRGRSRTGTSPGEKTPLRAKLGDVDLGLSGDLPDRPAAEEEAEQAALELARGKPLSRTFVALASALLFALPIGLLLGARRLERVQRDRAVPIAGTTLGLDLVGGDAIEALPLLQPLPPLRAPEPTVP